MFQKLLVANRGEIAIRILRTCRNLGIKTVAIYEPEDRGSLHVRLADECVMLESDNGYYDQAAILRVAIDHEVQAIHPGYGYLAEQAGFARACEASHITWVGPDSSILGKLENRLNVLQQVRTGGFLTPAFSNASFGIDEWDTLTQEAKCLGFPLLVKFCKSSLQRSSWEVSSADELGDVQLRVANELADGPGQQKVFLQQVIEPTHLIRVQVLGDCHGNLFHLGERDGSLLYSDCTLIEESPAPCLTPLQREQLCKQAIAIARLFDFQNAGTVEFLVHEDGQAYFVEIKPGLLAGHPVHEWLSGVDLVAEQIRSAANERLRYQQADIMLRGWSMQSCIHAVDPSREFLPAPGHLRRVRLPGGPFVRVDALINSDFDVLPRFDTLLAKLIVWGTDRSQCLDRLRTALREFSVIGIPTDLSIHLKLLENMRFCQGSYTTGLLCNVLTENDREMLQDEFETYQRDLAVAAALNYLQRRMASKPVLPERILTVWHRESRRFPR